MFSRSSTRMSEAVCALGVCSVCGIPAQHRCGACKSTMYCTREHQKQDWKNHKQSCKPPLFEPHMSEELGRYLVSTSDLYPGDVIINEQPIIVGPKQVTIPLCLGCYSPNPKQRCPQCLWPLCSVRCPGKDNLEHHGVECSALAGACAPIEFDCYEDAHHAYEAIMVLRCILLQRRSPRRWKQILAFEAHEQKRKGSDTFEENKIRVVGFLRNFVGLANWDPQRWDVSEVTLHRICGVLDVNSLEVRISDAVDVQALYPTASLLEHSCVPNVRMVFDENLKLTVTAALQIPKGQNIKTMYTHALWGTQARRDHLKHNKYFMCKCQRCTDPTELGTYFSALKCVDCKSGIFLPVDPLDENGQWLCKGCKSTLSAYQVSELSLRLGDEVDRVLAQPDINALESLLEKLDQLTHSQHYHQYAVKHSLVQLLARGNSESSLEEEERKKKFCEELLHVTELLDPGSARLAVYEAVLCIELHSVRLKLAKRDGNSALVHSEGLAAKKLLERAVKVLRFESPNLPEGRLSTVAQSALNELNHCLKDM